MPKPLLLLILDGWGDAPDAPDNAISQAHCPHWRGMLQRYPHTLIKTNGLAVGLPDDQMGNSEVGHMNLGAGRVVYQDYTRINLSIENGSFARNQALLALCQRVRETGGTLHVFGLLSAGGVHSHEAHIFAALALAKEQGLTRIAVHAFLDGRDTPPRSALPSLENLQDVAAVNGANIYSVAGRYYAMDRDKRWERVLPAYTAISEAQSALHAASAVEALQAAYTRGENDEFVQPTVLLGAQPMADGDAALYMNFRSDRARELTQVFVASDQTGITPARPIKLCGFVSLTEYAANLPVTVAFPPQSMAQTLPEILSAAGRTQLRIAETEKYAHVTFFFNGGREEPYPGEQRIMVPSPKVATYDLQPEMSLPLLTEKLIQAIRSKEFDVIVCNIANPDMVGHSGILSAAIKAVEAVDVALGKIESALLEVGGEMLLTADHGNLEDMWDEESGQPATQHSTNLVPLVYLGRRLSLRSGGALQDIAPTMLHLLGLAQPALMTGQNLLQA
jgi:2,3-bisphosphoglycerate-independent phosphoglycerate mutase